MLEDEEELAVSEEDFSMTSEPEEEPQKLSLGEMILKNKAIQEEVKARLLLQNLEKAVPERITKLPAHSHLKHTLKSLYKDHARLVTLSHSLFECDCSGNQNVETTLLRDFNKRHAAY